MIDSQRYETDILIIGAGPVGLFCIFQCGMLKMRCHVVDALSDIGGQCAALYPEKPIYDIPAAPSLTGAELIERLEVQVAPFDPTYHLGQQVVALHATGQGFEATTSRGLRIVCKAVIIAAGAGAFGPNRPPLNDLEKYEGQSVFYMVRRREDFSGKTVAIAGGGDSAVDWAVSLAPLTQKIYFIHRRDKFRAAPESVSRLYQHVETGKVEMVIPYQLHALKGDDEGRLQAVEVVDLEGDKKLLPIDALLPFFGLNTQLGPIADWGLSLHLHHIPVDPATQETNVQGIFAVGDVATYKNKLKLILTGFAEAATAAHAIYPLVFPGVALHFTHSTTKGLP